MPDVFSPERLAARLREMADRLDFDAHALREANYLVSAQQVRNAVNLLYDVERRLLNENDRNG